MPKYLLITPAEVQRERLKMLQEQCNIDPITKEIIGDKQVVLDHCHTTDSCRAALHRQSNVALGKIENAYIRFIKPFFNITKEQWLRNVAEYLEQDYSHNAVHTGWLKRASVAFNKLNAKQKDLVLKELGKYNPNSNDTKRKAAFNSLLKTAVITKGEVMEIIEYARRKK